MASAGIQRIDVGALPAAPLDAAAMFQNDWLAAIRQATERADCIIVLGVADHTHRNWRVAMVRGLAREAAPRRVNIVAGNEQDAVDAALAYLASAPGITGQLLDVDGDGKTAAGIQAA
ncbi:hypothetical protein HME9302_01629 [Alteripontixanthobacter maritimus]|uniref:Short chain dehydrogenase-like proteobacteria domain-containing protein n=1 Tax=Alteripontixanthobacter maritimus TaxID=2161824 RepID=A0A369Q7H7_9SPHN|nr:hypothetical protein [Alteripontixanthobacter maritimus]RDC60422.1 hypothetical protein HME9302_01629 [Alteripontixanthobacter maritimus]